MTRHADTSALSLWDARLESQFAANIASIPTPIAPRTSPNDPDRDALLEMDDLTTDELAKARRGIEQRKRDRNRTPRDPTPPEAA